MQRIAFKLLFSFCILFCSSIQAQNYHVCDVSKDVCIINKRTKTPVKKMQVINIKERLEIPQYGYIVLIDSANMKSCRIDKPCRDILKNIISANKATIEQLTERYFRYIWGKMCGGKEVAANSTREQIVTATYRDIDTIRTDSVARSMSGSESTCKAVVCKADNSQNTECFNVQCKKAPCTQAKCPNAQCKEAKCPNAQCKEAKCPNAQCKEAKCPNAQCKEAKCPNAQCKEAKCPNAQCKEAKCPNAQCKQEKCPNAQCKQEKCPNAQCKQEKCPNAQCKEHKCIENK